VLRQVGLGYLRLGQPATELSGGEAQRIKLATELQRTQRGHTLYVLDEPTTGLHPADVEKLIAQLDGLIESGNTVIVVEHDMRVAAGSDWVMDIGPGAGDEGGHVVAFGTPAEVAGSSISRTAPYLSRFRTGSRPTRQRPIASRHLSKIAESAPNAVWVRPKDRRFLRRRNTSPPFRRIIGLDDRVFCRVKNVPRNWRLSWIFTQKINRMLESDPTS
jgi:ABC-type multidrug transport system ATPase subunit